MIKSFFAENDLKLFAENDLKLFAENDLKLAARWHSNRTTCQNLGFTALCVTRLMQVDQIKRYRLNLTSFDKAYLISNFDD